MPADNSTIAEVLAAHEGIKASATLSEVWHGEMKKVAWSGDNLNSKRAFHTGWSAKALLYSASIGLRLSVLKDLVERDIVEPRHVPGVRNPANIATKVLGPLELQRECVLVGLVDHGEASDSGLFEEMLSVNGDVQNPVIESSALRDVSVSGMRKLYVDNPPKERATYGSMLRAAKKQSVSYKDRLRQVYDEYRQITPVKSEI